VPFLPLLTVAEFCSFPFFCTSLTSISSLPFFFTDTRSTDIYTLSLHDALPIYPEATLLCVGSCLFAAWRLCTLSPRQSPTRRARSEEHTSELQYVRSSYAVYCLKKKK